jgi:putative DNA primase/helicase
MSKKLSSKELERIANELGGARKTGNGWDCHCPCHDDKRASLSLGIGDHGVLIWKCQAGCSQDDVMEAIRSRGLLPQTKGGHRGKRQEKVWRIWTVDGKNIFEHVRVDGDGDGDKKVFWRPTLKSKCLTLKDLELYGAKRLNDDVKAVVLCEGEKATDAAVKLGLESVGTVCGASSIPSDDALAVLKGRHVTLWPDNDDTGRGHMAQIAKRLKDLGIEHRTVEWPDAPPKGDAADFATQGGTLEQFRALPEAAPLATRRKQSKRTSHRAAITVRELTDLGNAERLVDEHGKDLRYVNEWGWMWWDNRRWKHDGGALHARALMAEVSRGIHREADQALSREERERLFAHAIRSESDRRITAALHLAEPKLAADVDDFDQCPFFFNCKNGVVDLRNGTIQEHCRENMITQLAPFPYGADTEAGIWVKFLQDILPDKDVRLFVWKAVGYSATGNIDEQVLLFCHGEGSNGKSTFLETIAYTFGDYAQAAAPGLLLVSYHEEHSTGVADLHGARFVTSIETGENRRLDETQVKALTGGDTITARHMRKDFFRFNPTHKLWLASNHKPIIRGTDHAIWRRIRLIPFTTKIPDERIDSELPAKLKEEAPGILAWIVRGAQLWHHDRLKPPAAVIQAVEEYRNAEDLVGNWLEDEVDIVPKGVTTAKDLYTSFRGWCEDQGYHNAPSQKMLASHA